MSLIYGMKEASPSKGTTSERFPHLVIAKEYEAAGADCISYSTEPKRFLGSDDISRNIRNTVSTPMLRKYFTVDEYQLYEAKVLGVDAVPFICALPDMKTIERYLGICDALGLSILVEVHDKAEIEPAIQAGAKTIGINNCNLKNSTADFLSATRLRERIPAGVLFAAESGITGATDIVQLKAPRAGTILVGEALTKAPERYAALRGFRRAAQ